MKKILKKIRNKATKAKTVIASALGLTKEKKSDSYASNKNNATNKDKSTKKLIAVCAVIIVTTVAVGVFVAKFYAIIFAVLAVVGYCLYEYAPAKPTFNPEFIAIYLHEYIKILRVCIAAYSEDLRLYELFGKYSLQARIVGINPTSSAIRIIAHSHAMFSEEFADKNARLLEKHATITLLGIIENKYGAYKGNIPALKCRIVKIDGEHFAIDFIILNEFIYDLS